MRTVIFPACLVLTLVLPIDTPTLCQVETPLTGTVTMKDGQPIAGVEIYGSLLRTNYRPKRNEGKTDKDGNFRLEHPGEVVHFSKDNFQPQTLVIKTVSPNIHVVLEPASGSLVVEPCGKRVRGEERIGWGWSKDRFWFKVPKDEVAVLGGKWDVDYVRYGIRPAKGHSDMELYFGFYSIAKDPGDDLFINSRDFGQRNVVNSRGRLLGRDSWGQLRNGKRWRQTAIPGIGGAVYRDADPDDTPVFDRIIESICMGRRSRR